MKALIIIFSLVAAVSAHVCLLNPQQRGSLEGINTEEAKACSWTTEPCGGQALQTPAVGIKKGSSYTVVFQKNKSHFTTYPNGTSTDGYFEVGFWTAKECHVLIKIADSATPSLTLYTPVVTMPNEPVGVPAILQVTYVTNNPEAPPKFYQCSDIKLF